MAEGIKDISDNEFESDVIKADKPVVIDFWAPWCGPCKAIAPAMEALAGEYSDKAYFFKCNVDDNPVTPGQYGIRAIPTLIFFKDGEVFETITGLVGKSNIEKVIEKML